MGGRLRRRFYFEREFAARASDFLVATRKSPKKRSRRLAPMTGWRQSSGYPALLGSGRAWPRGRPGPTAKFAPSLARTLRAIPPSTALLGGVNGTGGLLQRWAGRLSSRCRVGFQPTRRPPKADTKCLNLTRSHGSMDWHPKPLRRSRASQPGQDKARRGAPGMARVGSGPWNGPSADPLAGREAQGTPMTGNASHGSKPPGRLSFGSFSLAAQRK